MKLRLFQIEVRERAIKFSKTPPGNREQDILWIPRSVIEHVSRDKALENGWRPCEVTVEDWFAEKNDL